jgi:hypothetical protein
VEVALIVGHNDVKLLSIWKELSRNDWKREIILSKQSHAVWLLLKDD